MTDESARSSDGFTLPDFAQFDAATQAYEAAKLRYIRSETSAAEHQLRESFARKRAEINGQIDGLRDVFVMRQKAAVEAAQRYEVLFPRRVHGAEIDPPSLWERIVTFNRVDRLYREAARCAEAVESVKAMLKTRRDRLEAMEQETRRAIYLREEAVRKRLQTPEGMEALKNDPFVRAAYVALQAAMAQRAHYDEQVRGGLIPAGEARDRDMAQRGWSFASLPLTNVMIAGIVRYGELAYYLLRDGEHNESLLSCDPALEPLRDRVFDVLRIPGGFAASLHTGDDGAPARVLDHLKGRFASDEAAEAYASHRTALREERVTVKTPQFDQVEGQLIEALASLAATLRAEPGSPAIASLP